jgi:serine/threonine protein kinase
MELLSWSTCPPDASSEQTLQQGVALLTRYDLLDEVARGGMGVVYRARHRALDRLVAVKVTLPGASAERFLREAQLLARIKSPHVVTVHDFDVLPNGCPTLVMEWVEGTDLLRLIRKQPAGLPEETVLRWMKQTCQGMQAAADQGIIHRDLKPSNILIDGQGQAQVADFGLARGPGGLDNLSLAGTVMGTPYYMAPEQAEDPHGVDTRADVYSFGATFYHALTGAPPFDGATAFTVLFKHKMEPPVAPKARNPQLSDRTCEVLERCLAKSPGDRFASFAEVLRQLQPGAAEGSPWDASEDGRLADYLARYQGRRDVYLERREELQDDRYEFPSGRVLRILRGNIVEQQVEAIVSSDDEDLTMGASDEGVGGAARAILRAAGPVIAEEARRYVPVRPGRAVVTSAGALPARFIFHGVTLGASRDPSVRPSRDLISEILASCFYHADSLHVQTIAFPLLGTGKGGFSQAVCLDTMFRFLARTLLRGITSVREARVVLFHRPVPRLHRA